MNRIPLTKWFRILWPMVMLMVYLVYVLARPDVGPVKLTLSDGCVVMGCLLFTADSILAQRKKSELKSSKWGFRLGMILCLAGIVLRYLTRL